MNHLAVTGYASLDYVLALSGEIKPDRTTHARRDAAAWPRAGGCPSYVALAAAMAGQRATPVMWLGDDQIGQVLVDHLDVQSVDITGIAQVAGAPSPSAVMAYQPDGGCACLYDPGPAGREALNAAQRAAISNATHLCLCVGPAHLTREILSLRDPNAHLFWAVKDDPACFTPDICTDLSAKADVIFCSAAERGLIGKTTAVIVQTRGAKGVTVEHQGTHIEVPVSPVQTSDTTGAGDTFAGGYIAALMAGPTDPARAAQAGITAAQALLRNRQRTTE